MSEECADCGAVFADPAELVQHVAKVHSGGDADASLAMNPYSQTPGFTCSLCGATFATPEALAEHDARPHPAPHRAGPT
jgi:hypothetical protein